MIAVIAPTKSTISALLNRDPLSICCDGQLQLADLAGQLQHPGAGRAGQSSATTSSRPGPAPARA